MVWQPVSIANMIALVWNLVVDSIPEGSGYAGDASDRTAAGSRRFRCTSGNPVASAATKPPLKPCSCTFFVEGTERRHSWWQSRSLSPIHWSLRERRPPAPRTPARLSASHAFAYGLVRQAFEQWRDQYPQVQTPSADQQEWRRGPYSSRRWW
jgi:hypothetical protein